jgi:hypothetical protein
MIFLLGIVRAASDHQRAVPYERPNLEPPYRVLLLAAATDGWYGATAAERERLLGRLAAWFDAWTERGARLLASFDDDLFMVGQPAPLAYSVYVVYELDDLALVPRTLGELREEVDGIRLDAAFRMEARVGRRLFLLPK